MELEALKQALLMELQRFQNRIYSPKEFQLQQSSQSTQAPAGRISPDFSTHPKVDEHLQNPQYIQFDPTGEIVEGIKQEISKITSFPELVRYLTYRISFLEEYVNNEVAKNLKNIMHIFFKIARDTIHPCVIDYITTDVEVFILQNCIFLDDLIKYSIQLGFQLRVFVNSKEKSTWARDYYLTTTNQVNGNRFTFIPPAQDDETDDGKTIIGISSKAASNSPIFMDTTTRRTLTNDPYARVSDVPMPEGTNFMRSKVQIEGGNLISAVNRHGQHKYIIGEAALLNTVSQLRLSSNPINWEECYSLKSFDTHSSRYDSDYIAFLRQLAKREIQRALNIDISSELVVVPQWVFHIDMQMAYLGKGQFILHSFDETINLIDKPTKIKELYNRKPISPKLYLDTWIYHNNAEKQIIYMVQKKLKKHGFEVYLCPGALFIENTAAFSEEKIWLTNFMNGIAGEDRTGRRYFITADSPYPWIKDHFCKQLNNLDINVIFVNVNDNYKVDFQENPYMQANTKEVTPGYTKAEKTVWVINNLQGSVRCQTNLNLALYN